MQDSLKTQRTQRRAAEVAEKNDKILNREGRKGIAKDAKRSSGICQWLGDAIAIVQNARQS